MYSRSPDVSTALAWLSDVIMGACITHRNPSDRGAFVTTPSRSLRRIEAQRDTAVTARGMVIPDHPGSFSSVRASGMVRGATSLTAETTVLDCTYIDGRFLNVS